MKISDKLQILHLCMFLLITACCLYLAFTIEMYPLNYIWFTLVALLGIIGVLRGIVVSLLTAIFIIFGYGSWILYQLYIEKSLAEIAFNDLLWLFVFPVSALLCGVLGRELNDFYRQIELIDENYKGKIATDELTGFQNNEYFRMSLDEELSRCIRYGRSMTLLLIEIRHYQQLWKSYGKTTGDEIVRQISEQIDLILRNVDKKAYLGDGLFAAVLPETAKENAEIVKTRLEEAIYKMDFHTPNKNKKLRIRIKVGYASYPEDGEDISTVFDKAKMGLIYNVG